VTIKDNTDLRSKWKKVLLICKLGCVRPKFGFHISNIPSRNWMQPINYYNIFAS
jgi:hypothetical protein